MGRSRHGRFGFRYRMVAASALVSVAGLLFVAPATAKEDSGSRAAVETIRVNGQDGGRTFHGVGALSASSSRLLVDYPEPERGQILDYLFKPNYGASLHILKVEIGADTNSTSGAEASHMRTPTDLDCDRGFEWWLMKEAKARNPQIDLYGLMWGAPNWVELWSQDHVDYLVAWLECAERHDLRIDYLGGGNENGAHFHGDFFVALDRALRERFPEVKIVADDDHRPPNYWAIATALKEDAAFHDAVDIAGAHTICGWRTPYRHCATSEDALSLDKPLWISEQSSQDTDSGGEPLARAMTRSYIDARTTANINWSIAAGFYSTIRTGGTGMMLAQWPWSGYYKLGAGIWVNAHMTQFTEPGWRYIDSAVGYLDSGASYTTLRDDDTGDYSMLVETVDATAPTTVQVEVAGGLSRDDVHVWSTDVSGGDEDWFVERAPAQRTPDGFAVTLQPGRMYTLSTTTGQHKGTAAPTGPGASPADRMPLPYVEDFEDTDVGGTAPYVSDLEGRFEGAPCGAGREGTCYRQIVTDKPVFWHPGSVPDKPTTVVGDPQWWGDYQVSVAAMLEEDGFVEVVGRSETHTRQTYPGYHLRVDDTGRWRLYAEDAYGAEVDLATGTTSFGVGEWHDLILRFQGDRITVSVDGRELATVTDGRHTTGMVGLAVAPYQRAQFDDLKITPTATAPRLVPQKDLTATASSTHAGLHDHHFYSPDRAIDGRPETMWGSEWDPQAPLPQSITLELESPRQIWGLTYQPRLDTYRNRNWGTVTRYTIYTSLDGITFTKVSEGTWPVGTATRLDQWAQPREARYVRLEANAGVDGIAVAGELNLTASPVRR